MEARKMWKNKQDGKIEKDSVTVQLNTSFKSSYYSEFESNESGFSLRNKSPLTWRIFLKNKSFITLGISWKENHPYQDISWKK